MTVFKFDDEYLCHADEDELYHYGIRGMKWYQRRFQNPDGTLTELGKRRYLKGDGKLNERGERNIRKLRGDKYVWRDDNEYKVIKAKQKLRKAQLKAKEKSLKKMRKEIVSGTKNNMSTVQETGSDDEKITVDKFKKVALQKNDISAVLSHPELFTTTELNEMNTRLTAISNLRKNKRDRVQNAAEWVNVATNYATTAYKAISAVNDLKKALNGGFSSSNSNKNGQPQNANQQQQNNGQQKQQNNDQKKQQNSDQQQTKQQTNNQKPKLLPPLIQNNKPKKQETKYPSKLPAGSRFNYAYTQDEIDEIRDYLGYNFKHADLLDKKKQISDYLAHAK